jgi:hypothetical protein
MRPALTDAFEPSPSSLSGRFGRPDRKLCACRQRHVDGNAAPKPVHREFGRTFYRRVEDFLAALLPHLFEFGRCDVPGRLRTSNHKCFRLYVT